MKSPTKTSNELEREQQKASITPAERRMRGLYAKPDRFAAAGHFFMRYDYKMPAEHSKDDLLDPSYWTKVGMSLNLGDFIEVVKDDFSEAGQIRVTSSNPRLDHAAVQIVSWTKLAQPEERTSFSEDGFRGEWRGLHDRWVVIRESDGHQMHVGLNSIEATREYIRHLRGEPAHAVRAVSA